MDLQWAAVANDKLLPRWRLDLIQKSQQEEAEGADYAMAPTPPRTVFFPWKAAPPGFFESPPDYSLGIEAIDAFLSARGDADTPFVTYTRRGLNGHILARRKYWSSPELLSRLLLSRANQRYWKLNRCQSAWNGRELFVVHERPSGSRESWACQWCSEPFPRQRIIAIETDRPEWRWGDAIPKRRDRSGFLQWMLKWGIAHPDDLGVRRAKARYDGHRGRFWLIAAPNRFLQLVELCRKAQDRILHDLDHIPDLELCLRMAHQVLDELSGPILKTKPCREARQLALDLMAEHGVADWIFGFNRSRRFLGNCARFTAGVPGRIQLSIYCCLRNPHEVRDTLLHEIAHILAGDEHDHDEVWQARCREIGALPHATAQSRVDLPGGAWQINCGQCQTRIAVRRSPSFKGLAACLHFSRKPTIE